MMPTDTQPTFAGFIDLQFNSNWYSAETPSDTVRLACVAMSMEFDFDFYDIQATEHGVEIRVKVTGHSGGRPLTRSIINGLRSELADDVAASKSSATLLKGGA